MSWYDEPEFAAFLPYLRATAAGDKRHYAHPRFDLRSGTPWTVARQALDYRARCVACGALMAPFRQRKGEAGIYFGVTCIQERNNACSRGAKASQAYDAVWQIVKDYIASQGQQVGLLR